MPVRTLEGCSILLFFAKPSLRTFVTFEVGVVELGGFPVYLPPGQVQIGDREPTEDVARNLSRWCHAIVARVYGHDADPDPGGARDRAGGQRAHRLAPPVPGDG